MIIKNFKKLPSARGITYVFKSEIFCFSQNHLCVIDYNGDVSEKYFVENEKYIVDIVAWDNFIFCSSNSSKFYFIDRLKNSIDVVSKRFISNEIIYNTSIIYFETIPENKNKYKFGYFDFKKKEDYPIGIFSGLPFFFRNEIFHIDGGLLSSYSNKGKVKWKRNIKHLVNNKDLRGKCLGIVGDIKALIISNNTLIGNSKTSGEIKWHVTNFNIKRYQLDENDGKL